MGDAYFGRTLYRALCSNYEGSKIVFGAVSYELTMN